MGIFIKRYLSLFIGIFLLGSSAQVKAQCNDAVTIRCVSVDAAGDVTITWTLPITNCGWQKYVVYASSTYNSGYVLVATILIPGTTSVTIPFNTLPASPNSRPIFFCVITENSSNPDCSSDTVSSMCLTVTNTPGVAALFWNPVSTPLPQGSSAWYEIFREYNNVWTLIDSTQNPYYNDTITYCDSVFLNYQIQIMDTVNGVYYCTSTSNVPPAGGKFASNFPPPIIVLDTVSVTAGGAVDISWIKSSKNNVIGYIIYKVVGGNNIAIDTVFGRNADSLLYYLNGGNPSDSMLVFGVAALDSCHKDGPISYTENTLFLKVKPNICAQNNTLTWNGCEDFPGSIQGSGYGVGGYKVFYSVNSGPFQLLASLDKNARTYIDNNLATREYRCYYVQVYDSANNAITASSNITCDSIHPPPPPKNNYLRTASVILNTSSIQIVGYIDSSSGAEFYEFQRSTDTAGGFSTIYTMKAPLHSDSISYIDNAVKPAIRSYRYQITTLDSCDKAIDSTNIGQTMLLNAIGQPDSNTLTWNDYSNWYEGPAYYLIYRSIDGINYSLLNKVTYTGLGCTYLDYVKGITAGQGTFYYYIKAVENDTTSPYPYPFVDTSYSNVAKAYQNPTVYIPNAFCPYGKNKIFIPVGVFIDVQGYDFSIFDRWGDIIFESNNPLVGWDGRYNGSKVVQEGIYAYLLTFTSSKGQYFQMKGIVTLLK